MGGQTNQHDSEHETPGLLGRRRGTLEEEGMSPFVHSCLCFTDSVDSEASVLGERDGAKRLGLQGIVLPLSSKARSELDHVVRPRSELGVSSQEGKGMWKGGFLAASEWLESVFISS